MGDRELVVPAARPGPPARLGLGRRWTTSPGATVTQAVPGLDHEVARGGEVDGRPGEGSPTSSTRTAGPECRSGPVSAASRSPPPGRPSSASRRAEGLHSSLEQGSPVDRAPARRLSEVPSPAPRPARCPPTPEGPASPTLTPTPTTTAADPGGPPGTPGRPRPGPRPPSAPRQQVVGPLERRRPPRPRPRRRRPRPGPPPPCTDGARSGGRTGRRRTDTSRAAPGGASQRRPSRPRPAVWWSATATSPSGAPRRASSSR